MPETSTLARCTSPLRVVTVHIAAASSYSARTTSESKRICGSKAYFLAQCCR